MKVQVLSFQNCIGKYIERKKKEKHILNWWIGMDGFEQ